MICVTSLSPVSGSFTGLPYSTSWLSILFWLCSLHSKLFYRGFVQINAQPRRVRNAQVTVLGSEFLPRDLFAQGGLLLRHEFHDQSIGYRIQEMQRRRDV